MNTQKKTRDGKPSKTNPVTLLPGYKDRLPVDAVYWEYVLAHLDQLIRDYSFQRIETPVLEDPRLYEFVKTDHPLFTEQVHRVTDRDGVEMVLRPENLLPLARAYREHGFVNHTPPVKLAYCAPQFRRLAKHSSGKLRQFTQAGFVIFGDDQPVVDAQLIAACYFLLHDLKLDVQLHINTIGNAESLAQYLRVVGEYFKNRRNDLPEEAQEFYPKRPLALLQYLDRQKDERFQDAPPIIDHLTDDDRDHFVHVLEHLDEVDVPYVLNPRLFTTKPFRNRTVVAFRIEREGTTPLTIGKGGRCDTLLEFVGNEPAPAFGIAFGIERLILALKHQAVEPPLGKPPEIFLAQLGDSARRKSLKLFLLLQKAGLRVAESLSRGGIKGQLETATKLRATYALIIGQKEIMDDTVLVRDMESGIQEVVAYEKIIPEIKKRLEKARPSEKMLPVTPPPIPTTPMNTTPHA